jgi:hypothetical protein
VGRKIIEKVLEIRNFVVTLSYNNSKTDYEMKVRIYKEDELKAKYGKEFKPMTAKDIELCTWLCAWNYVKHSSGKIVKCEGTPENKWRILGTNGLFPMQEGQMVLGIKKPAKKKEW